MVTCNGMGGIDGEKGVEVTCSGKVVEVVTCRGNGDEGGGAPWVVLVMVVGKESRGSFLVP